MLRRKVGEEGHGSIPRSFKFLKEILQRAGRESSFRAIEVLVEPRERGPIVAREPKGAVHHDTLDIRKVPDHLLDRPLPGRVGEVRFLLGERGEERDGIMMLCAEMMKDGSGRYT
jgi:hypothetical protein